MNSWLESLRGLNAVSLLLGLIWVGSVIQGVLRGASRSAGRLISLVGGGLMSLAGILLSIPLAMWLSPKVQEWLMNSVHLPDRELSGWEQFYYTAATAIRDFQLMRFVLVMLLSYWLIRCLLGLLMLLLPGMSFLGRFASGGKSASLPSRLLGAGIGAVIGSIRCIVIIFVLFIAVTVYPDNQFARYVEASPLYRQGAETVIEPLSGKLIKERLPVLTESAKNELNGILERKYEVIDANIPADLDRAAAQIVKGTKSDEEKARLLYNWIGTRISYDYDKVTDYETKNIWHEQTPKMTFDTRKGVCIDYARLYAVMARSQGLKVKVVTGLGADGKGGYGSHAWNEVYLAQADKWIPLDATWAKSGNWFNPSEFDKTHIAQKAIG
ncbi:cysteine protease [Paenibacillus sp. CAA11]|uniref:transglutaminase domain-containing protein n=1 Tax=Paenibacillus sp. CAA11 TaxID=1532905 RepID=UPI000D35214F|nr:transglutaminase domain-containing protein [Paenibacillus sp. CAA11]AWB45893.1 cysteine protease [Paenibacillus sp. CAA11]